MTTVDSFVVQRYTNPAGNHEYGVRIRVTEVPFRFVSLGKRKRYRFQGSENGNGTN